MRKIISLLLVLVLVLGCVPMAFAAGDTAYWHESKAAGSQKNWMGSIGDEVRISDLSIPGTHDTMAYAGGLIIKDIVRTQTMTLEQQLNSGIRFVDIRVAYKNTRFELYHGSISLGFRLETVLDTMAAFLKANPTETILMRFKQENTSASDAHMKALFDKYYEKYADLFFDYKGGIPTLGEVRGKVLILSDVLSITQGINYRTLVTQDDYNLTTNWDLYSKWEKVRGHLNSASRGGGAIYLNYLSGSGGSFPYFVASGKSSSGTNAGQLATGLVVNRSSTKYPDFPRQKLLGSLYAINFEGTNKLTMNYISDNSLKHVGIIAADFPGEGLIRAVINANY